MEILSGTSGYSFKAWRGAFYPEKLPERLFLEHYSRQLPVVELNNTFYRTPTSAAVEAWCAQVPDTFRFTVKAPRRITHLSRLKNAAPLLQSFAEVVTHFGHRLGVVLFQFPPQFGLNFERLQVFDEAWPRSLRTALEFRHPSWDTPEVRQWLGERGMAWVTVDEESTPVSALDLSKSCGRDFVYVRLRRETYTPALLQQWRQTLMELPVSEAYALLKHEVTGPAYAAYLNGSL